MGAANRVDLSYMFRLAAALLAVAVTFVALSCGDDSSQKAPTSRTSDSGAAPTNLVTDGEIKRAPQDTPQEALLRFFQAVQFQDVAGAQDEVTTGALRSLGRPKLRAAITVVGSSLGRPQISSVRREGSRATLRALILGYEPGKTKPATTSPASFRFRRIGGKWWLSDLSYLTNAGDAIIESQRRKKPR